MAVDGIVGRDVELGRLLGSVSAVAAGRGGVVWVGGEPGIGKSTLVEAGLVEVGLGGADAGGVRVFRGAGDELTQLFPLRMMAQCLGIDRDGGDGYRVQIADLLAGRGGGVDAVRAAGERMVALVQRECATSPVAVVADDLQWADQASLSLWQRLAEITGQTPLLVVGVVRPVPQRDAIDELRQKVTRIPDAVLVELGPLPGDAVAAMVTGRLSATPGPGLRAWLTRAGGNPLYLREMLDALIADNLITVHADTAELTAPTGPPLATMSAAIGRRLDFLTGPARTVLRAAAVLGSRFTTADLAMVSNQPTAQLAAITDEAVTAGVLAHAGPELTFRHALIRQALHDELPGALRVGLHAHVAQQLADTGAAWDQVAQHLLAAPQAIDGWVLTWLAELPATALYALPATAADLLQHARKASPPGHPQRAILTTRLTTVLRLLHRWDDDLIALGEEALATVTDPQLAGEIAWNLTRCYQMLSRTDDGLTVITRVLDGPDPGVPWRSRLRAERAMHLVGGGRSDESVAQARLAIAEGERDRDPVTVGRALNALLQQEAGSTDGLDIVERGLKVVVGEDSESMDLRLLLLRNRLVVLGNLDRIAEVEAALAPTIALLESQGSPQQVGMHRLAITLYLEYGDWDQAMVHIDQMPDTLTHDQSLDVSGAAALIAIRRGDRATAERHISAVADVPYVAELDLLVSAQYLTVARALLAEAHGDLTTAVEIVAEWLDPRIEGNAYAQFTRTELLPELVRLALGAGNRAIAAAAVAAADADAKVDAVAKLTMRAGMCRAMVEDDPAPLIAAADHFDRLGRRPEAAFAVREAAVRLAVRGDIPAARMAFDRATAIYEGLGAFLDLRLMQARMRPYGIRSGSHAPHRRATTGWPALTATEREVAALVAHGGSNPDIATRLLVSPRTVETHVAHVLTKLQLRSRRDIAQEVTRHEPQTSAL